MKWLIFSIVVFSITHSLTIEELTHPPPTDYGDPRVACIPGAPGSTRGFSTSYQATSYACPGWTGTKTYGSVDCYVGMNGKCGMEINKYCDKCIHAINSNGQVEKCRIIDFCHPDLCSYYDVGHLQFLNNNYNNAYKFTDKGIYVYPYSPSQGVPRISWTWTTC